MKEWSRDWGETRVGELTGEKKEGESCEKV